MCSSCQVVAGSAGASSGAAAGAASPVTAPADDTFVLLDGSLHQKLHHVPYYIDILLNHLGMFNLGIISTFFTLRSYFINLE